MSSGALFKLVDLGYCQAVMLEPWNAARGRFFVGYRTRHGFSAMLGNGVVDEFRTISGPVFVSSTAMLGGVYDAGMLLAESRDPEAPIDSGWPPLVIGIDAATDKPIDGWQEGFLTALCNQASDGTVPWQSRRDHAVVGENSVDVLRCIIDKRPVATFIVTDAPLLPAQLERLADLDDAPVSIAVSTGNRLPYVDENQLHEAVAVSEARLRQLTDLLATRLRA